MRTPVEPCIPFSCPQDVGRIIFADGGSGQPLVQDVEDVIGVLKPTLASSASVGLHRYL